MRRGSHSVGLGDGELADGGRVRHGVVAVGGEGLDVAVVVEEEEVLQDGDEDEAQAGDDPDLGGKTTVLSACKTLHLNGKKTTDHPYWLAFSKAHMHDLELPSVISRQYLRGNNHFSIIQGGASRS